MQITLDYGLYGAICCRTSHKLILLEMEPSGDDQEVTVEVLPQTVTEIIYLNESDVVPAEPNYYIPSEEELEDEENESYEIGSVDPARLQHMPLILDESQSFVLLSQQEECFNVEVALTKEQLQSDENYSDEDDEWHPQRLEYNCDVCNTKCHSRKTLKCHKLLHTELAVMPLPAECICKVCGLHFDKAQALSHHFRSCHEPPKLICNICGCPCAHDSALLAHYKKHEPKQFSCDVCNSGYDNAVDLNNHKKTHATDLLYACNKCDAEFASTAAVSAHLRSVHGKSKTVQSLKNPSILSLTSSYAVCHPVDHDRDVKAEEYRKCLTENTDVKGGPGEIASYPNRAKRRKR